MLTGFICSVQDPEVFSYEYSKDPATWLPLTNYAARKEQLQIGMVRFNEITCS